MELKDLLFVVIIVGLGIGITILLLRSSAAKSQEQAAEQMSEVLVVHLRELKYDVSFPGCRVIAPGDYARLQACLEDAKTTQDLSKLFHEKGFQNTDEKINRSGYLVVENAQGGRTFASANFTLRQNNEPVARGCVTPGDIAPGFTCRFDLLKPCKPGDNLEITYNAKRAFLKTCS